MLLQLMIPICRSCIPPLSSNQLREFLPWISQLHRPPGQCGCFRAAPQARREEGGTFGTRPKWRIIHGKNDVHDQL